MNMCCKGKQLKWWIFLFFVLFVRLIVHNGCQWTCYLYIACNFLIVLSPFSVILNCYSCLFTELFTACFNRMYMTIRYKFDDERVTKEDTKRALEEQYGGEEEVIIFSFGSGIDPYIWTFTYWLFKPILTVTTDKSWV